MAESKEYDSNIAKKANTPLAKKLQKLIPDAKTSNGLKDYLGVSIQAINQYKQGTALPKTENLIKIADYFHISVDYLLGFTETPNRDTTIQSAFDVTGISADALCKLSEIRKRKPEFSALISAMIIDDNCEYFLSLIETLINQIGNDQELIELNVSGKEGHYYSGTLLKAILQTQIIENLSRIADIYGKLKEE